ncbi:RNA-directed DNA polymerase, eukaryota, reverse transcriptase zinc-binding domain protein [Tanacetum coccineum]
MGDRRTKEDHRTCQVYGRVVEAYIPNRRSKTSTRFGFVLFIQVKDVDRLKVFGWGLSKASVSTDHCNSYAGAVKQKGPSNEVDVDNQPSIVLDDSCIRQGDLSLSLMGNIKDFGSLSNLKLIMSKEGVGSWFSSLQHASNLFMIDSRVTWVDIEGGKIYWVRAKEVSGWVPDFMEDEDVEEYSDEDKKAIDSEKVSENLKNNGNSYRDSDAEESEDPFNIYDLLNKKQHGTNNEAEKSSSTLKYPPGFTPEENVIDKSVFVDHSVREENVSAKKAFDEKSIPEIKNSKTKASSKEEDNASRCSGHFRHVEGPPTGGSILQLLEDVVKVGEWILNAKKCLIISVYAPQEVSEKKLLWNYLDHVISTWTGETIFMGDFNEVRSKDEQYGSMFNAHSAAAFNLFISSGGLVEVPLGGCSFTWCHKSRQKMSKLDMFLISNGLMGSCSNISAITLDRYLSDHRPILLRENDLSISDSNAILKFMKKLKCIKDKIRLWTKEKKESSKIQKSKFKGMLSDIDTLIDNKCVDQELLNKRSHVMHSLHDLEKLESLEKEDLERIVTKDEIKRAVWDCVDAVSHFFNYGMFLKGGNSSFIALILKLQDAKLVKDFRPISLIGSLYKIIAKTLANRLVGVLGDIVNEVQSAFVSIRQILDVGGLMSRINSWDEVVDSLCSRLSMWKMKTLSIGGRLTLLKLVLGSMPNYNMSMFKVPSQVLKRMEAIRCHFFNGAETHEKKMCWVKWSRVLASKDKGGMGVSSYFALNRALMFKWVWRFLNDGKSLWTRFIKVMYGRDGNLGTVAKRPHPSAWLDIVNELHILKNQNMDLISLMKKKVGNGADTLFWEEVWRGDTTLRSCFPRVYALKADKSITVAGKLAQVDLAFSLRRKPRDGVEMLFDYLPARLNLSKRGVDLQSILCPMCNKEVESTNHIFFACSMVRELYRKIVSWWDVCYSEFLSYETDIREKDKKKAKNDQTKHGMEKTKSNRSQTDFDDSSVYSISEGEGDTYQSISVMVQDTPIEEIVFMAIEEDDESDDEQEEENNQFSHHAFMFHPGSPTKIAEMVQAVGSLNPNKELPAKSKECEHEWKENTVTNYTICYYCGILTTDMSRLNCPKC